MSSNEHKPPSSFLSPNYVNPDIKGTHLLPVLAVLMVLSGTVTGLRIMTRSYVLRSLGPDDWLIIPALATAYGLSIVELRSDDFGWGRHIWDIQAPDWSIIRRLVFASQLLFTHSVAFTKISILIFYLRFATTRPFKIAIWITFGLVISWAIAMTALIVFQCSPVSNFWIEILMTEDRHGCLPNEGDLVLLHGVLSVLLDIVVLLLPIPTVLKLQLPKKQKIGLIGMFGLGLIVCGAGALRIVAIRSTSITFDASWYGYDLWIYTSTEAHVAIICASVPSLKPLVGILFPRFKFSTAGSKATGPRSGPYNRSMGYGDSNVRKGYPLTSIITSRMGSEETIYRNDEEDVPSDNTPHMDGVMKTTEIRQVVIHRNEPFV